MTDRIIFGAMLVLAVVYFWATSKIPSLEIGDPLGPKAFPRLLIVVLLVAAAMLFMEMWRARKTPTDANESAAADDAPRWRLLAGVVVATGIYFAVFQLLGFVISTTAYLIAMMAYFNPGKWVANLLTSVLFSVLSFVMFKYLGVTLPQGILPF